ncbi:MAG: hypothetical protein Q9M82_04175 [Mariprofundus sp.]|nr:hypothetical protein [Mariprofundus sp.]
MAISVQPVDGLINRLLQQNSKPASVSERSLNSRMHAAQDQVSISSRAQSQPDTIAGVSQQQSQAGGKALESHLLNLYKMNDLLGV